MGFTLLGIRRISGMETLGQKVNLYFLVLEQQQKIA